MRLKKRLMTGIALGIGLLLLVAYASSSPSPASLPTNLPGLNERANIAPDVYLMVTEAHTKPVELEVIWINDSNEPFPLEFGKISVMRGNSVYTTTVVSPFSPGAQINVAAQKSSRGRFNFRVKLYLGVLA